CAGLLESVLARRIDMGMIGSGLGRLFPVDMQARRAVGKVNAADLLLAGMGEPGRFAQDDLRFLLSNVTVAVKGMGYDQFATTLIGTRRRELSVGEAVRGFLEGNLDGCERLRAVANVVAHGQGRLPQTAARALDVVLVDPNADKLKLAEEAFDAIRSEEALPGLKLTVIRGSDVATDPAAESTAVDTEPDVPATLLRVTRGRSASATAETGP